MRTLIALALTTSVVRAAPLSTTYDGSTLTMRFGDGVDWVRLIPGADGNVNFTDETSSNFYGAGVPLLTDEGESIPADHIWVLDVDMGNGTNGFLNPGITVRDYVFLRGGDDRDVMQTPHGGRDAFVFLGAGNDQFIASHTSNNWVWGGDGDDNLHASFFGTDYLDGGPGSNTAAGYAGSTTTFVHHPGAADQIRDNGGDSTYVLAPGTAPSELFVFDGGGVDSIIRNGHLFDVVVTTIVSDTITGQFHGWDGVQQASSVTGIPEPSTCKLVWLLVVFYVTGGQRGGWGRP